MFIEHLDTLVWLSVMSLAQQTSSLLAERLDSAFQWQKFSTWMWNHFGFNSPYFRPSFSCSLNGFYGKRRWWAWRVDNSGLWRRGINKKSRNYHPNTVVLLEVHRSKINMEPMLHCSISQRSQSRKELGQWPRAAAQPCTAPPQLWPHQQVLNKLQALLCQGSLILSNTTAWWDKA